LAAAHVAGMGAACGAIALDSAGVKRLAAAGTPAILVRRQTVTTDIEGMALAAAPRMPRWLPGNSGRYVWSPAQSSKSIWIIGIVRSAGNY
jgi:hypothetical protein